MAEFLIMPERCGWSEVEAETHEMAFRLISCWFSSKTKIAVLNKETGETVIFTREEVEQWTTVT